MSKSAVSSLADARKELLKILQLIDARSQVLECLDDVVGHQADGAEQLLGQLDELKPRFLPLPRHTIADMDGHTRGAYSQLLTVVAMTRPLTAGSSRLLQMVLASIGDELPVASLNTEALLDAHSLAECVSSLRRAKVEQTFLLDALVLTRMDGPLTAQQQAVLYEIVEILGIEETSAGELANLAAVVLGLPAAQLPSPREFDYSRYRVWDEFLWQPLPNTIPEAGISGGRWDVSGSIRTNRPWTACNADFRFLDDAVISTDTGGSVSLKDCNFFNARLRFRGKHLLEVSNCHFQGSYREEAPCTVIDIAEIASAELTHCRFETTGARSILVSSCKISLDSCSFERCGNQHLHGGALAVRLNVNADMTNADTHEQNFDMLSVDSCTFDKCEAAAGGAIRIDSLPRKSISKSIFMNCRSLSVIRDLSLYDGPSCLLGGAIFCTTSSSRGESVSDSRFENCGVFLGAVYSDDANRTLRRCAFYFSGVSELPAQSNRSNCGDCVWDTEQGSIPLERAIPSSYQPWWNTFE